MSKKKRKLNEAFMDSYENINQVLKKARIDKTWKRAIPPEKQDILSSLNLKENLAKIPVSFLVSCFCLVWGDYIYQY